ncbi:CsbD family protein [Nitratireductor thuwali]|uniref:CsbD family protein n=1 Tax=Nitratireductor thuwali TaxID=2267699 RepID=UPI0030D50318
MTAPTTRLVLVKVAQLGIGRFAVFSLTVSPTFRICVCASHRHHCQAQLLGHSFCFSARSELRRLFQFNSAKRQGKEIRWDQVKEQWAKCKAKAKQQWAKRTDDTSTGRKQSEPSRKWRTCAISAIPKPSSGSTEALERDRFQRL